MEKFPYKANDYVVGYTPKDYSNDEPAPSEYDVNCSLGVNPAKIPQEVFDEYYALNPDNASPIKDYPHNESVKKNIVEYYKKNGVNNITEDNIILADGSVAFLTHICFMFLGAGRTVYGHKPQFTAFLDAVQYSGASFDGYLMKPENNYKFIPDEYIAGMSDNHDLFIVENAINPTGEILRLDSVKAIAKQANKLRTVLIVDEAYGDYIEDMGESAINLINKPGFENVILSRTFSKGFGMAGVRLGYAVASKEICKQLSKIEIHFNATSISRLAVIGMLKSGRRMINFDGIAENKKAVLDLVAGLQKKNLAVATTGTTTPIITLYSTNAIPSDKSLYSYFLENRILVVSCEVYQGLNNRSVRIMIPEDKNKLTLLTNAITNISNELPVS
jgi:histidinol-phosphate aminotransferase